MTRHAYKLISVLIFSICLLPIAQAQSGNLTDAEIKKLIIHESVSSYSGNCACPFNLTKNGARCGKRSAWSRAGGKRIICYEDDISEAMLQKWKQQNIINTATNE